MRLKGFALRIAAVLLLATSPARGGETNSVIPREKMPSKTSLDLYLLIGQSNMAGRGNLGKEDKTPHPRVLVFTLSNDWEQAVEPVTRDRATSLGVGPGLAFGKVMAEKNGQVNIGLVPCAVGGTPLRRWEQGGDLYSNAVFRAKLAMRDGNLKGILWHQGESDSGTDSEAKSYGKRLAKMIADLRADLQSPKVPFVVGELGEFLYDRGPAKSPYAKIVNQALDKISENVPFTACASSHGLKSKADQVHFDAASQREFGRRYAAEILRLQGTKLAF